MYDMTLFEMRLSTMAKKHSSCYSACFILESSCISVLFVTSNCVGALQELMHNLSPFCHQVMLIAPLLAVHSVFSHIHMHSCYAYHCTSCCFCLLISSTHHSRLENPCCISMYL
ncbi:hypothetical protein OsJ_21288 [Oryza sativa Japonica Group]|uniref:Uncharacterized protein n=1 Tax=Oryza sativa subsp. japonica TaxID=39947 RepID=B9FT63_ORYSJ|nr:hypothetical protein OsJ_21288 [Oryza sativa Japonica Group]